MAPQTLAELSASYRVGCEEASTLSGEEITKLSTVARENFETVFITNPRGIVRKPYINHILFRQYRTQDSSVPEDLQLQWHLENWAKVHIITHLLIQVNLY